MTPAAHHAAAPLCASQHATRPWLGVVAGLWAALLPHLWHYAPQAGGSFRVVGAGLGVVAVGALLTALAGLHTPWRTRLGTLGARWPWARALVLGGGLAVVLAFGLAMRPVWLYAHAGAALALSVALLGVVLGVDDAQPVRRRWLLVGAVLALLATVVRVRGLATYPDLQPTDEGWLLAWAVGYLRTGQFSDALMTFGGHDVHRFYLPMAWWLRLVGVGLWEARLFTLLLTLPLALLAARAARLLVGRGAGWLAAAVMLCSAVVMVGARVRHDVGLALAVAACVWLYAEARHRDRAWLHLLAGVCVGWGWFGHYHAVGFGPALALGLYLPHAITRWRAGTRRPEPSWALFVLGGLLGAGTVVLLQVLPDLEGFLGTRALRNPPTLPGVLRATWDNVSSIARHARLELVLVGVAALAALVRRRVADVSVLAATVLAHIALGIMAATPWDHYPMPLTPLYALLVAGLFLRGFGRGEGAPTHLTPRVALVAAAFLLIMLGWSTTRPLRYALAGGPLRPVPPPAATWVLQRLAPDQVVAAEHVYYLHMHQARVVSALSHSMMPTRLRAQYASDAAVWDAIAPDVVILDGNVSTCCVPPVMTDAYLQSRGYRVAATFAGARVPVQVYVRPAIFSAFAPLSPGRAGHARSFVFPPLSPGSGGAGG